MPEWLAALVPEGWTVSHLAVATIAFGISSAVVSVIVIGFVVVRLPTDYFSNHEARRHPNRNPVARVVVAVARNVFGWFLVALGLALSLPGVPGQGVLTILMGVLLVDFPGKHRAEYWLLTRRGILIAVNALRARAGKPPLEV